MSDTQSLHALLDQTSWIHALARRLVADPHLAADLAQDTCVDALEQRPDGARPLRGWLATVMRHNLAKLRRGEQNRTARERAAPSAVLEPATHDVVERAEAHRNVVLAVLALEEPYRSTLLMRFFEQLSYDEIARRTGSTRAAVNSRVTRGLVQLRQRLEHAYGGDRRALALALVPLAKLPTGVAATLFGVQVMHIAIGTAAATLLAVGVSVGLSTTGAHLEPASLAAMIPEPARATSGPLRTPLVFVPAAEPSATRVELAPQREQEQRIHEADKDLWKAEVFRTEVLAPTVESLAVNTGSGDVEVAESNSGRLEIQAKVHARLGVVPASELTQVFEDHVEVREEKGVLVIEDKHRRARGWGVDFVVRVPGRLPLSANSGSGDVVVRRAGGSVSANSGSGDVRIELAGERLTSLNANTGSGDVRAEVLSIEKKLNANTGSGDVSVLLVEASSPGAARLNTGSGDVLLVVPANIVGSFELETYGDSIEFPRALGLVVQKDVSGRQRVEGVVGSGGGSYGLNSGSGGLRVELGNALPVER